jgi:CTP:molybdopterin cytidylyltransferase MocA
VTEAVGGIVLAAGEGRRFGGPKQLAPLGGRPLLEHALRAVAAVPSVDPVVVVLGAHAEEVRAGVDLGGAGVVVCDDWADGQAASLRCGLDAVGDVDAVLVLLGDQPGITPQVIAMVLGRRDDPAPAARAVYGGEPGHPVLIKRQLFPRLRALRGDTGARDLLAQVQVLAVEAAHLCSNADVDTPDQLEAMAR